MFDKQTQQARVAQARSLLINRGVQVGSLAALHAAPKEQAQSLSSLRLLPGAYQHINTIEDLLKAAILAMGSSGWAIFLNTSDLGWLRAAQLGLDLRRSLTIELAADPKLQASIMQLWVDCSATVVMGNNLISSKTQRALTMRARKQKSTILTCGSWEGAAKAGNRW